MSNKLALDYAMKTRAKKSEVDKQDRGSGDEYDDVVQDDELKAPNTGADDGDDDGAPEKDQDTGSEAEDMVSRIMKKRKSGK